MDEVELDDEDGVRDDGGPGEADAREQRGDGEDGSEVELEVGVERGRVGRGPGVVVGRGRGDGGGGGGGETREREGRRGEGTAGDWIVARSADGAICILKVEREPRRAAGFATATRAAGRPACARAASPEAGASAVGVARSIVWRDAARARRASSAPMAPIRSGPRGVRRLIVAFAPSPSRCPRGVGRRARHTHGRARRARAGPARDPPRERRARPRTSRARRALARDATRSPRRPRAPRLPLGVVILHRRGHHLRPRRHALANHTRGRRREPSLRRLLPGTHPRLPGLRRGQRVHEGAPRESNTVTVVGVVVVRPDEDLANRLRRRRVPFSDVHFPHSFTPSSTIHLRLFAKSARRRPRLSASGTARSRSRRFASPGVSERRRRSASRKPTPSPSSADITSLGYHARRRRRGESLPGRSRGAREDPREPPAGGDRIHHQRSRVRRGAGLGDFFDFEISADALMDEAMVHGDDARKPARYPFELAMRLARETTRTNEGGETVPGWSGTRRGGCTSGTTCSTTARRPSRTRFEPCWWRARGGAVPTGRRGGYPGDPARGTEELDAAALVDARVASVSQLPDVLSGW